jgi:hypothetical protein
MSTLQRLDKRRLSMKKQVPIGERWGKDKPPVITPPKKTPKTQKKT